jgi:hypothetical protein
MPDVVVAIVASDGEGFGLKIHEGKEEKQLGVILF